MSLHAPIAGAVLSIWGALAWAWPSLSADLIHWLVKPSTQAPTGAVGYSSGQIDRSVEPRQDFYACANGNWLRWLTIANAESDISGLTILGANLDAQLQRLAVKAS